MTREDYLSQLTEDMEIRGMSPGSVRAYNGAVSLFLLYCEENSLEISEQTFRSYLLFLQKECKIAINTNNLYNSAIRFFLEITLEQNINYKRTARLKREHHYPVVFTKEEVQRFFEVIDNLKYRAVFYNIYGSGLRASEIGKLRIQDVDSKSMRLLIQQSKGKKDRYTILSQAGLTALREYWKAYRPCSEYGYLFPGNCADGHLSVSGVEIAFRKYYALTGIDKKATVHTLRHSFATHLLEAETEPIYIKNLLGHSTFDTTNIYLHMANTKIFKTASPLDEGFRNV